MWLVPVVRGLCSFAIRTYYRFEARGGEVPRQGPVIVVANHPNGIVDPITVVATAGRPIRFLAKAPLFSYPIFGSLIKGAAAIPVYRKQDEGGAEVDNSAAFRAVHGALSNGDAIGVFPEGISHDEPALVALKTGAARLALGAAGRTREPILIVPVGLSFREKERFRSRVLAVVGDPIEWSDLSGRDEGDSDAVRELTSRIERSLHEVTVNLTQWEDARLVENAEAIYAAELGLPHDPERRHEAQIKVSRALEQLREDNPAVIEPLVREINDFALILDLLRLRPRHLDGRPSLVGALRWVLRRVGILAVSVPVIAAGTLVFVIPYSIVAVADRLSDVPRDVRSTYKLLCGGVFYIIWILVLSAIAGFVFAWELALLAAITLPLLGLATQWLRERWGYALLDVRRFFALRRSSLRERLLSRRREIALQLDTIWKRLQASRPGDD